jgi:hypothetical protein
MQPQRWDRASRLSVLPLFVCEGLGFLLAVPCCSWSAGRDLLGKGKSLLSILRGAVHAVPMMGTLIGQQTSGAGIYLALMGQALDFDQFFAGRLEHGGSPWR